MTSELSHERQVPALRLFMTLLHLATLGVLGFAALSVVVTLLATGIGLIPVLGIGVLLLIAVIYLMFGLAWLETERVSWLYSLGMPALGFAKADAGFKGYLVSLWRQFTDARMWRAIANLAIASVLGYLVLFLMQAFIRMLVGVITGSTAQSPVFRSLGITLSDGGSLTFSIISLIAIPVILVLVSILHRTVSVALIASREHEAELLDQVRVTSQQRAGALRAADVERTRIERDLHDGVQPRLVSIGMTLGLAKQHLESDPETARALIDEAHTSTKAAVTELRQLARGIHASVLDDRGLDAALSALVGRSHIPVVLDSQLNGTPIAREAETAVYFAIAESLTNAAKHSLASEARVTLRLRTTETGERILWARVEDNGIGAARVQPGGGLDGIMNRITAAGGNATLDSPQGGPTSLEVSVPCAS